MYQMIIDDEYGSKSLEINNNNIQRKIISPIDIEF